MTTANAPAVLSGRPATSEEIFYADLGDDLIRNRLTVLGDAIQRFATLSASLAGGAAFFLKDAVPRGCQVASVTLFLLALLICVVGMLGRHAEIGRRCPYEIKLEVHRGFWLKTWMLRVAAGLLILGLAVTVIGIMGQN